MTVMLMISTHTPTYAMEYIDGGIYIPTFMDQIDKHCEAGHPCPFNLVGAAIGDGCWGGKVGLCAFNSGKSLQIQFEFFRGHAMLSQTLAMSIDASCGNFSDEDVQKTACSTLLNQMQKEIGTFDIYNIYDTYVVCICVLCVCVCVLYPCTL